MGSVVDGAAATELLIKLGPVNRQQTTAQNHVIGIHGAGGFEGEFVDRIWTVRDEALGAPVNGIDNGVSHTKILGLNFRKVKRAKSKEWLNRNVKEASPV